MKYVKGLGFDSRYLHIDILNHGRWGPYGMLTRMGCESAPILYRLSIKNKTYMIYIGRRRGF